MSVKDLCAPQHLSVRCTKDGSSLFKPPNNMMSDITASNWGCNTWEFCGRLTACGISHCSDTDRFQG